MRRRQRDAQAIGNQHHDRQRGAGSFGEIFSMTREGDAGVVDDALLDRRGDHGVEIAAQTAVGGDVQQPST